MALLPTNQRDQLLVGACIVMLALVYGYYTYLWSGKDAELTTLQAHLDTLQLQNDSARADIASGTTAKLQAEAQQYGQVLAVMRRLVPNANEVPSLLEQISTAARATGLEIGPFSPDSVIPGSVFDTYRYHMQVNGPYHRVAEFLTNVGSLTRIIVPMNVSLVNSHAVTARPRPGEAMLDVTFDVQTYVAKTAAPRPAAAASTNTKTE